MLTELYSVVCEDVIISAFEPNGSILFKENSIGSKVHTLEIDFIPKGAIVFTLDYQPSHDSVLFQQLSTYVNKKVDGINKSCDLVIVWPCGDDINALFFDLKSDRTKVAEFKFQLDNSALFFIYLIMLTDHRFLVRPKHINVYEAIGSTKLSKFGKNAYPSRKNLSQLPFNQVLLKTDSYGKAIVSFLKLINYPCRVLPFISYSELLSKPLNFEA